jgi:hypothetical protein
VTASACWLTSRLSTWTLIESIGAVVEKFATTWTGELTLLALGETMVTFCAKAMAAAKRNTKSVKMYENLRMKNPFRMVLLCRAHFWADARCEIHQVDVLSGRTESVTLLRFE